MVSPLPICWLWAGLALRQCCGLGSEEVVGDLWVMRPMIQGALRHAGMMCHGRGDPLRREHLLAHLRLLCFPLPRCTSSSMPLAWLTMGSQPRPCNTASRSPLRSWATIRPATLSWPSK